VAQKQTVQDRIAAEESDVASLQNNSTKTFSATSRQLGTDTRTAGRDRRRSGQGQADLDTQINKAKAPVGERLTKSTRK